jgi:hypothetical protein
MQQDREKQPTQAAFRAIIAKEEISSCKKSNFQSFCKDVEHNTYHNLFIGKT